MQIRFLLRLGLWVGSGILVLLILSAGIAITFFRASLPELEGGVALTGLRQTAEVERDAQGIVTIRAGDRLDLARATGFVHGQDRFFSMDVQRRFGSGELSALLGAVALPLDKGRRLHAGPDKVRAMFGALPEDERILLEAYAAGVNAGLASLGSRPPEYWLLRVRPEPWRGRDTLAVGLAMAYILQDAEARSAWTAEQARAALPPSVVDFLLKGARFGEVALDEDVFPIAEPLPLPVVAWAAALAAFAEAGEGDSAIGGDAAEFFPGSNAWAAGSERTHAGRALLAGDPHLSLSVPNIWYRLSMYYEENGATHSLHGATIPGAPFLVAGSNTHVAWSLTNSYARLSNLVRIETDPADLGYYAVPGGREAFGVRREEIFIKGQVEPVIHEVRTTRWGPLRKVSEKDDGKGRPDEPLFAIQWLSMEHGALTAGLHHLERVASLAELFAVAGEGGIPTQNLIAVDSAGNIGWTLIGRLHDHSGTPRLYALIGEEADAVLNARVRGDEYPSEINPASGLIWSANHRKVGGERGAVIGEGGFARDGRALRIRDELARGEGFDEASFLRLQLDIRTVHFDEYRVLLVRVLQEAAASGASTERLRAMQTALEEWDGAAGVDSLAYRVLNAWYVRARRELVKHLFAPLGEGSYPLSLPGTREVVRRVFREESPELLPKGAESWTAFHRKILEGIAPRLIDESGNWTVDAAWGAANRLEMAHPFSSIVPGVARWLNMPAEALPGSAYSPRVQGRTSGASFRMVVSPGQEGEALFHMPGGNSGHFLSPFYRAGHDDWVRGNPTRLLPGEARHVLLLFPEN